MMAKLLRRGEELARTAHRRAVDGVVERLTSLLQGVSITTEEMLVVVSGKGLFRRWLNDPELRFLSGGPR